MAYTKIGTGTQKNVWFSHEVSGITGGPWEPYFHKEDIDKLMGQTGAINIKLVRAIVGRSSTPSNQRDCYVLIGIRSRDFSPTGGATADIPIGSWLIGPDNFAALACPPYNHNGGERLQDGDVTADGPLEPAPGF